MIAKELAEKLLKYPDLQVMYDDDECGIGFVLPVLGLVNKNHSHGFNREFEESKNTIKCVYIVKDEHKKYYKEEDLI